MRVSKLEAAKTQIETSIRLYFSDGDTVSTHTLTGAANQILRDIGKHRGIDSMKESFLKMTKPEKVKEMKALLNSTQSFFKHADNDPEGTIDFNPEETYIYLFDCCLIVV
ncbi:hypothetical protein COY05_00565 [Candidatus Peregrinibacteria bacterium CG_4_10_14_0_2_um_filter_38_24]|nr:MAG: hypothetical protein COY05_00565 [Candidatus Peregrinibacteria bacterium CG_4_10_14_0_2_um_filter_38_24]